MLQSALTWITHLQRQPKDDVVEPWACSKIWRDEAVLLPSVTASSKFTNLDVGSCEAFILVGDTLDPVARLLSGHGLSTIKLPSIADIRSSSWNGVRISHLLIDIDKLGGIQSAIDDLRRIRDQLPELVVLLVSRDFASDDLSCDRLAACDVSLRAPVSLASLEFGLTEASLVNNRVWRKRRSVMTPVLSEKVA